MKAIQNFWLRPKTTVAGILLGVIQIAPVLLHYGITLGAVNGLPGVAVASGIATALLGMLAKDPWAAAPSVSASSSTAKLSAWLLIALLVPLPWLQGCTASQISETENLVNVVISAAGNLAAVADPGAAWTADLPAALTALKTAEANFQAGTGTQADISNALLTVEDVIASVAPNSEASQLADILTTAIDAALAVLPAPATSTASASASLRSARLVVASYGASSARVRYNHHGKAKIAHRLFRSRAGDFKAAWNKACAKAGFAKAKL